MNRKSLDRKIFSIANPDDDTKAVAVWRNDTVVFYATGAKNDIQRFYQQFPL